MLKRIALIVILPLSLLAQEAPKPAPPKPTHVYKLDYVVSELDAGKRTDTKEYTLLLDGDRTGRLRVGTRIPVTVGTSIDAAGGRPQYQYMDLGVIIEATGRPGSLTDNTLGLRTRVEVSSIAMPAAESGKAATIGLSTQPIVRNFTGESDVTVPFNKPTTLFTLDEPNSKRSFQVQLTATEIR
jgi:hypothetical protein